MSASSRGRSRWRVAKALVALPALLVIWLAVPTSGGETPIDGEPPPADGYFQSLPTGSWSKLPDDASCTGKVERSTWEPRPSNAGPNRTMPEVQAVHTALATRPRATEAKAYDPQWDSWLLARVTGHHTGTTDENIQWAACKWGLADNLVRAVADAESTWYQYERHSSGACVEKRGCGDLFDKASPASAEFCTGLKAHGYDYQRDYGPRLCPKTFSIIGVMSWQDPAWGALAENQNGTFPFNRDSTAFALDYYGSFIRGCVEGWAWWLTGMPGTARSADLTDLLDGCVGAWFAGAWRTEPANDYIDAVHKAMAERVWLSFR